LLAELFNNQRHIVDENVHREKFGNGKRKPAAAGSGAAPYGGERCKIHAARFSRQA
nr:hypothetical protein [Tanacetum cinerariifolium]